MCQQKEELLLTYTDALNTLVGFLRLQVDAIVAGDPDYGRLDHPIEDAERRRTEAAHAYGAHVSRHACGCPFHLALEADRERAKRVRTPGIADEGSAPPAESCVQAGVSKNEQSDSPCSCSKIYSEVPGQEGKWAIIELRA